MHGGDHRGVDELFQQVAHQVAPGAVAVDDINFLPSHLLFQLRQAPNGVAGFNDVNGDAHFLRVGGKISLAEAEELGVNKAVQLLKQVEHMGLGPAGVAAANQMDHSHSHHSFAVCGRPSFWKGSKNHTSRTWKTRPFKYSSAPAGLANRNPSR